MLLDHVFITYSDNAYNPVTKSYEPIDPRILAYTKDSLVFDLNRRTIYAQGLEFGKHHHTTSNNWHTATVFDIEALGGGAKKGRSLEYSITSSKLYAKTPKVVKWNPTFDTCFIIDESDTLYVAEVDKNNNLEIDEENKVENVIDAAWSSDGSTIFIKRANENQNNRYETDDYLIYKIDDGVYMLDSSYRSREVYTVDCNDNFDFVTIIGDNWGNSTLTIIDKTGEIICYAYGEFNHGNEEDKFYKAWINSTGTKAVVLSHYYGAYFYGAIDLPFIEDYEINYSNKLADCFSAQANVIISPDGQNIYAFKNNYIYDIINDEYIYEFNGNIFDAKFIDNDTIFVHTYGVSNAAIEKKGVSGNNILYFVNTSGDVLLSNFTGNVFCKFNDNNTKAIVILLSEPEPEITPLKGGNNPQPGDVYIWEFQDNNVIGPIYNINIGSYDYEPEEPARAGTSRSIDYNQPNIKVIWNDDSSMFVIIDEFGNATVFDDEGNVISENIATGVSGGHWSDGNLYLDNAIETLNKPVIVDINLDIEGNLTYQTRNLQMGTGTHHSVTDELYTRLLPSTTVTVVNGISQSASGQVSYTYEYLLVPGSGVVKGSTTNHNSYSIVGFGVNTTSDQTLYSYTYVDLKSSASDGSYIGAYNVNSPTSYLRVITGINQERDGKISYSYQSIYTNHGGKVQINPGYDEDFISMVQLSANGQLSGTFGEFTNQRIGSTTSGVVNYVQLTHEGRLKYSYISLSDLLSINQTSEEKGPYTLQDNTSYQVITNVYQNANGSISYTYANFNTTHSQVDYTKTDNQSHVITNVSMSADGVLSYDHRALSETGTDRGSYVLNNDLSQINFAYNIKQNTDGSITYDTAKLKTNITSSSDNIGGVVYEVNVDSKGQTISYAHKNLTTNSGTNSGTKVLLNDSSYNFITSISQNAYGKISYEYVTLQNALFNFTNAGTTNGVLTNVHLDTDGKLSYDSVNLTTNTGNFNQNTHIPYVAGTYSYVLTGITQDEYGQITYSYTGIYTDAENNYKWHALAMSTGKQTAKVPTEDTIDVIYRLAVSTPANSESHTLSASYATLPTKQYVDNLMTANDALRYRGVITPASAANGAVTFPNVSDPDYSCGVVYKVNGSGYFGTEYVTSGDMIVSYDDNATNSSFQYWNVINNNVNLITEYLDNTTKNGPRVITDVHLYDDGRLSYASYSLGTQVVSTDDGGSNELLGSTYNVITGVTIEQDGLDTKLSYTYTTLTVNANHHSTNNNQAGGASKVVGFVNLSANGTLSYSYVDIAQAAYHYPVATTTAGSGNVIKSIEHDAKGHLTNVSYMNIATTDELVMFKLVNDGKIYLSGTIDNHADAKTLITEYSDQVYIENGVLSADKGLISGGTLDVDGDTILDGTLYVEGDTILNGVLDVKKRTSLDDDLTVEGVTHLNGDIYIGDESTDLTYINSKNINFNNDNPIDFTHLKSLWGVVGS